MSLVAHIFIVEKYGLRLNTDQLAEVLGIKPATLRNQVSAGTCPVKTYVENGRRYADARDVADYFDSVRASAA